MYTVSNRKKSASLVKQRGEEVKDTLKLKSKRNEKRGLGKGQAGTAKQERNPGKQRSVRLGQLQPEESQGGVRSQGQKAQRRASGNSRNYPGSKET